MARIVNYLLLEIAMCCSSCRDSLAWKITIWSNAGQFEISYHFKLVAESIICWKWRLTTCVEARFKLVRDLNALHGMTQYSFPVPNRSNSSQSCSIGRYHLITLHHSKQAPAALAKSFTFRNRITGIKITEEISIFAYSEISVIYVRHKFFSPIQFLDGDSF